MADEHPTTIVTEDQDITENPDTPGPDTAPPAPATFRPVPLVALVAVGFLALCLSPIAFQGGAWFLLFLAPLVVAVWVVRVRTRVDTEGLHVRGAVSTRSLAWADVSTLRLAAKGRVHAVPSEGTELELTGVRVRDLGRLGHASGGRISVPSPAEAEAAAEHARELEATRMRIAKLRDRPAAETDDEAGDREDDGAGREGTGAGDPEPGGTEPGGTVQDETEPGDTEHGGTGTGTR